MHVLAPTRPTRQSPGSAASDSAVPTDAKRRDPTTAIRTAGRRGFVLGLTGLMAGCRVTETESPPAPVSPPGPHLDSVGQAPTTPALTDHLIGAQAAMGVDYTEQERMMLVGEVEATLARVAHTRTMALPNDLAPATKFDPRLPGFETPRQFRSVRTASADAPNAPANAEDIAFASLSILGHWLARKTVTSRQLTELALARLREHGDKLECVVALTEARALAQADGSDERRRRGKAHGPLDGIPWGAKDLLDVIDVPSTWGATPFRDRMGTRNATVVDRLDAAGAVLVAKLTTGALAYGDIWSGGRTRNPWHLGEGSSGSSAGPAAATAAGLVGFAIGSETYGSIVSPAMRCGTSGLRPTFGRVARTGAMALCWSLDKLGPITRHVEDAALVLAAIAGADAGDPCSVSQPFGYDGKREVRGLRVGYVPQWFDNDDANDVDRSALDACRRIGVELTPITMPEHPYEALLSVLLVEAAAAFEPLTLRNRDDELRWQEPEAWPNTFRAARFISGIDVVQAERLRRRIMIDFDRMFGQVDCIFGPSFAGSMLLATNFTGHPSLTLRAGFVPRRPHGGWQLPAVDDAAPTFEAPHGVTLWGRLYDEATILQVGHALERELGVSKRRPRLT